MGRSLSLLSLLSLFAAASLSLFAAPALAEEAPPPAPAYGAPTSYGAPFPAAGGYGPPFEPPPAPTERLRPGMMATGILFVSLGATAMSIGSVLYASRIGSCFNDFPVAPGAPASPTSMGCPEDSTQFVGTTILLTGGIVTALGIPLWIFGASSERIGQAPREARAPTLLVGPRSAALRFAF